MRCVSFGGIVFPLEKQVKLEGKDLLTKDIWCEGCRSTLGVRLSFFTARNAG